MAVDTVAKRMAVAGVPFAALGPNVYPGTTGSIRGRAAAAWNYASAGVVPPIGGGDADAYMYSGSLPLGIVNSTHTMTVGGGTWLN